MVCHLTALTSHHSQSSHNYECTQLWKQTKLDAVLDKGQEGEQLLRVVSAEVPALLVINTQKLTQMKKSDQDTEDTESRGPRTKKTNT